MSWNGQGNTTISVDVESSGSERSANRGISKRDSSVLPFPPDTRERLTAFYRERDEADAARCASGAQKVRGSVWALGLARLERGEEVYESFGVLASAGIETPAAVRAMLDELPHDRRQICQIDEIGVVRTASLKGRMRSGR